VKFCTHPEVRHRLIGHEKTVLLRVMRNAGDHPNIVPLLEYSLKAEIPWLMYEFVEGGTLAELIESAGTFATPGERFARAVRTLHAIAGALARVHQLDPPIVHRDLKPHNVLMAGDVPRITDFGLGGAAPAVPVSDETGAFGEVSVRLPTLLKTAGSLRYASPEQMRGSPPNPRDDVFALGVMAYQMVIGDLNASPSADAADELRDAGVPDAFAALVLRSVAAKPERRPRDATEWQLLLAPLLHATTVAPAPVAPGVDQREQAEADYRRGEECYTGRGALQDYAKAREWYEKAAALGHAEAEFRLGWLHDHGRGVPRDAATARMWYERAARKGSANAQYNLGVLYKKGRGVPKDVAKARAWWLEAAEAGHAQAQANLGALYHAGESVPQDLVKARGWYEKAALQGDATAQCSLGGMFEDGEGGPRDTAKAREWYEKAAAQGDATAQYNLGVLYDSGEGVPRDFVKAREWWVKAAARGHAGAQYNLGALYHNGEGVPQDFAKAREWYEKAAAQGDSDAQFNLGALFEGGHGVAKNAGRAREWYRRAAEQGHDDAKQALERLEAE
jgi:TPR repeat protein